MRQEARRFRSLTLVALALCLGLAGALPSSAQEAPLATTLDLALEELFSPAPHAKASCFRCNGGYQTPAGGASAPERGKGASCAIAQSELNITLRNGATEVCLVEGDDLGYCRFATVITTACWYDPAFALYFVQGYATFGCRIETWSC